MNSGHKFPYNWRLSDRYPASGIHQHGKKVFGAFVCGGGSTMGYKLAGYGHLGGVEIDPKVAAVYRANHHPRHLFVEDIRRFNQRQELPAELYGLDLLDGSPPCSSFSMAGNREKDWGREKQFREGQELQRLDDLVFEYVKTIAKLRPKVAILENVKGLLLGNAKAYARKIKEAFEGAGYRVQVFLLNAASMGVPQLRERVFFIGLREGFDMPLLRLNFEEKPVKFGRIINRNNTAKDLTQVQFDLWNRQKKSDKTLSDVRGAANGFTDYFVSDAEVSPTITSEGKFICKSIPRHYDAMEYCQCGTFPSDYEFHDLKPKHLIGMSVPPVMAAQIGHQIYLQWLSKI